MQVTRRPVGMSFSSSVPDRDPGQTDKRQLIPAGFLSIHESVISQLKALEIDTKLARELSNHVHRLLHRRSIVVLAGLPSLLRTKFSNALEQLRDLLFVLAR